MFSELIDVKENNIINIDYEILSILLKDRTTNKNIIWATDNYEFHGPGYRFSEEITPSKITSHYGRIIRPRIKKGKTEQEIRIKKNAEVFTPSWICNEQINLIDEDWFKRENVFNKSTNKKWVTNNNKIEFSRENSWQDYIKSLRMEITCGEAPYLVSRYDTVTGNVIELKDRIGFLDRKFRVIKENTTTINEWLDYAKIAIQSIYGYDWQGDNVLLARENILYTYIDYYKDRFNKNPSLELVKEIATIISWNIWQMDGIKYVIPNSCENKKNKYVQVSLFGETALNNSECIGCKKNDPYQHQGTYCVIMNWTTHKKNKFVNLINKK
mgnify:CR=1 FL=1